MNNLVNVKFAGAIKNFIINLFYPNIDYQEGVQKIEYIKDESYFEFIENKNIIKTDISIRNLLINFGQKLIRDEKIFVNDFRNNKKLNYSNYLDNLFDMNLKNINEIKLNYYLGQDGKKHTKIFTKEDLLKNLKLEFQNFISKYNSILNSEDKNIDIFTNILLEDMHNNKSKGLKNIITDGRFISESKLLKNNFKDLLTVIIIPENNRKLNIKNKDKILSIYNKSNTVEEFVHLIDKQKLVRKAEEFGTLLVLHKYYSLYKKEKINKNIENDLEDILSKNIMIIENDKSNIKNLFSSSNVLNKKINKFDHILFISVSGGGKDTILSVINSINNYEFDKKRLLKTHKNILTLISMIGTKHFNINKNNIIDKNYLFESYIDFFKENDIEKLKNDFEFLFNTELRHFYFNKVKIKKHNMINNIINDNSLNL